MNTITFTLLLSFVLALCPETAGQIPRAEDDSLRIPYRKGDKWGLVDRHKRTIAPARYDDMDLNLYHPDDWIRVNVGGRRANERGARRRVEGGRWGFINGRGEAITPIKYQALVGSGLDRFPQFQRNGKWGVLDRRGRELLPARFDSDKLSFVESLAEDGVTFVEDIIWTQSASGRGGALYNSLGRPIRIPLREDESFGWNDGLLDFLGSGGFVVGCGIFNAEKTEVTRLRYNYCDGFRNGFAKVYAYEPGEKLRYGLIDARGREVVPLRYDQIDSSGFEDGFARVANNLKWGLINRSGVELTPLKYAIRAGES